MDDDAFDPPTPRPTHEDGHSSASEQQKDFDTRRVLRYDHFSLAQSLKTHSLNSPLPSPMPDHSSMCRCIAQATKFPAIHAYRHP